MQLCEDGPLWIYCDTSYVAFFFSFPFNNIKKKIKLIVSKKEVKKNEQ